MIPQYKAASGCAYDNSSPNFCNAGPFFPRNISGCLLDGNVLRPLRGRGCGAFAGPVRRRRVAGCRSPPRRIAALLDPAYLTARDPMAPFGAELLCTLFRLFEFALVELVGKGELLRI